MAQIIDHFYCINIHHSFFWQNTDKSCLLKKYVNINKWIMSSLKNFIVCTFISLKVEYDSWAKKNIANYGLSSITRTAQLFLEMQKKVEIKISALDLRVELKPHLRFISSFWLHFSSCHNFLNICWKSSWELSCLLQKTGHIYSSKGKRCPHCKQEAAGLCWWAPVRAEFMHIFL